MRIFSHVVVIKLLMFVPGLLWWVAFWPATMSTDSLAIWSAVVRAEPLNEMPVAYWLFVLLASLGGRALALVSLLQVVGLTFAIHRLSFSLGLSIRRCAAVSGLVMLTPLGGLFAVTLWKDVPATICFLLAASCLAKQVSTRGISSGLVLGLSLLFLAGLFRFEAPIVIGSVGVVLAILSVLAESRARIILAKTAGLVVIVAAIAMAGSSLMQSLIAERGLASWNRWIPAISDLAYVASTDTNARGNGIEAVGEMVSGTAIEFAADCKNHGQIFYDPGFDAEAVRRFEAQIPRWWLEALINNPYPIVDAHLCRGAPFLPPPLASNAGPHNWVVTTIEQPNEFELSFASPVSLRQPFVAWTAVWTSRAEIVAWPGLLSLIGTVSLVAIGRWRKSRSERLTLAAFAWGTLLPFAAWTVYSDFRYGAVAQLIGATAFAVYVGLLAFPESSSTGDSDARSATTTNSP